MDESVLERKRLKLQTLQTIEHQTSKILQKQPDLINRQSKILKQKKELSHKLTLLKKHELRIFIDLYEREKKEYLEIKDKDEDFDIQEFDRLFNDIKDDNEVVVPLINRFKRKKGILVSEVAENDLRRFNDLFTIEEGFGLYLDLFELYSTWLNLNLESERVSYVKYLEIFDLFELQSLEHNYKSAHRYLIQLNEYLINFVQKTLPLFKLSEFLKRKQAAYDASNDFYCEVCAQLFSKDTVFKAHRESKKHLQKLSKNPIPTQSPSYLKYQIHEIVESLLKEQKLNTKLNVERKKALTERERIIEQDHINSLENETIDNYSSEEEEESNAQEQEDDVFNPLNLPIGLDGQPIPFWLYKLHGLGKEYPCEICGNFVYKGRKAFDKHFNEPKHLHGLKCLGITSNNSVFKDIVKIDEVNKIWNSLRNAEKEIELAKENAVEVEDEEGNVMSEKVYNDLKKQGLI